MCTSPILAEAHLQALTYLLAGGDNLAVNVGTGAGSSIREVLEAIERVTGRKVPVKTHPRRPGDPAALFADAGLARRTFGFAPRFSDLDTVVRTAAPFFGLEARA